MFTIPITNEPGIQILTILKMKKKLFLVKRDSQWLTLIVNFDMPDCFQGLSFVSIENAIILF